MDHEIKAFVIMPFDTEFETLYRNVIIPALENSGYLVTRADSSLNQQNILRDVVRGISEADLVIAELTTNNPNVMYELGLAHGLNIPTVMIAQNIDDVPFDLRSYRIQVYSTRFDKIHLLTESLAEIAKKNLNQEITFGSPVIDFISVNPDVKAERTNEFYPMNSSEDLLDLEEPGILDYIIDGEAALGKISEAMVKIAEETQVINDSFNGHGVTLTKFQGDSQPGTAARIQRLFMIIAKDIDDYTARITSIFPIIEDQINIAESSYAGYVAWFKQTSSKERDQLIQFRSSVEYLVNAIDESLEGLTKFRDATTTLTGISRVVNIAARRLYGVLDYLIVLIERIRAFSTKTILMTDELLDIK
jgi:hypothetical protein